MRLIVSYIRWIMLVSGLLTLTMNQALVFPGAAMLANFGEAPGGAAATLVVRNWGALIGLVGAMLIWGAFRPDLRRPFLILAGASKIVFIGLVLSAGGTYLGHQAGLAIAVDGLWVLLFALYLVAAPAPA
jgi:hypothetical protein